MTYILIIYMFNILQHREFLPKHFQVQVKISAKKIQIFCRLKLNYTPYARM